MKVRHIVQLAIALLLIALTNGCVTRALWQNDNLETWNQPNLNPNIRIFASQDHSDMLVVYDEYSERADRKRTRAYWLNENEKQLAQRHAPHFVSTNSFLTPIPVIPAATNQISFPPPPYARIEADQQSFTLFLDDHSQAGPYNLPTYNDGKGKVEKFFLTPVAVTADATIVGGVVGYYCLEGRVSSHASYSFKP